MTRTRILAVSVLLVGLAFVQDPGFLVADTKMDLVRDPARFLGRALHLWDGGSSFGQLQNQSYGYLWPMGPFFLGADALAIPDWASQRAWQALVLVVGFVGTTLLTRALGVRSDLACLLAGLVYALSPRVLTIIGRISIEAWPGALVPWVLLPLVLATRPGATSSPRRMAALSALAIFMAGGVNAAATAAVLPLGALWLLTRPAGPRRRALMIWWPVATFFATLWWLIPLFLLGAYSPPFLDFIESASVTTFPGTISDAVRGTSNWVPYIDPNSPAGESLLTDPLLIGLGGVVLAFGLAGLLSDDPLARSLRPFLGLGLLAGVGLVTMGHLGAVQGWFAADLHMALDGALAPLRNVHKFDPVIRLPLAIGVGLAAARLLHDRQVAGARFNATVLTGALIAAGVVSVSPVVRGDLETNQAALNIPGHWNETAAWLDEQHDETGGTALLVPGSSFATYFWGDVRDEPMQWLARSPWAVRDAIPLTPPGTIRMLDEIERRIADGDGSPALVAYLQRAGVRHLVVRNDLQPGPMTPDGVLIHQAIERMPGVERVTSFGPILGDDAVVVGEDPDDGRLLVDSGWERRYPAVEVYELPEAPLVGDGRARRAAPDAVPVVVGGPEDLLDLLDLDVLGPEPTILGFDADTEEPPAGPVVLTDGLRRVERNFGQLRDSTSATLTDGAARRTGNPTRDYLPDGADAWTTSVQYRGGVPSASTSMSDATAFGAVLPGRNPYAAIDGDGGTRWQSGLDLGNRATWRLDLPDPTPLTSVAVTVGPGQPESFEVLTSGGTSGVQDVKADGTISVELAGEEVDWIEVRDTRAGRRMSLAEVTPFVDGVPVEVDRALRLPTVPDAWRTPDSIVLRAVGRSRTGCADVEFDIRCVPGRDIESEETGELHRVLDLPSGGDFEPSVRLRPRPGPALDALASTDQPIAVRASSSGVPDVRAGPLAAIDGDRRTTWLADPDDAEPILEFDWVGERKLTGMRFVTDRLTAGRRPTEILIESEAGDREVSLRRGGRARFQPLVTDRIRVTVLAAEPLASLSRSQEPLPTPVGISEVRLRGVPFEAAELRQPIVVECGEGPVLTVGDTTYPLRVETTGRELIGGGLVDAEVCADEVVVPAGTTWVTATATAALAVDSIVLHDSLTDSITGSATRLLPVDEGAVTRVVELGGDATDDVVVVLPENVNPGWAASAGESAEPITVDGWQQGWRVDGADLSIDFAPDRTYRAGLLVGLLGLLVLAALLGWPAKPSLRPAPEAPPTTRRAGLALGVLAAGSAALLAGPWGLVVAVGALPVALLVARVPNGVLAVAFVSMMAPIGAYAARPWSGQESWAGSLAWPHYVMLAAVLLPVLVAAAERLDRRIRADATRVPGSSTSR